MALPLRGAEVPCGHVTLVSAMYLSKAIVVTDSAGVSDYVTEGITGLLCAPGDAAAMAKAVQTLWIDRARADRFGEQGREFAESTCSDASTTAEMTAYFAQLGLAR